MHSIINFFRRLLYLPLGLVSSPTAFIVEMWNDPGRGRSVVLAAPAIFVFLLVMGTLGWAQMVSGPSLIARYDGLAEKSNQEAKILIVSMVKQKQILNARVQQQGKGEDGKPAVPNEQENELSDLQNQERMYLEKLIELDDGNPKFRFRLAMVSLQMASADKRSGYLEKGLSLLQQIAPIDKAVYGEAHLWMAKYFMRSRVRNQQELDRNRGAALKHVEFCLVRDKNDVEAKRIKGELLAVLGRQREAYEIFRELFNDDPSFYRSMISLNSMMDRKEDNQQVLKNAVAEYRKRTRQEDGDTDMWVDSWRNYILCLKQLNNFDEAVKAVDKEIVKNNEDLPRRLFLRLELAKVYTEWASHVGVVAREESGLRPEEFKRETITLRKQLEYIHKAFDLNPRNNYTLQFLTDLGLREGLEEEVKAIYDAKSDRNAPAVVLSELGSYSLEEKEYETAIRYFEQGLKKAPKDPQILNNLAYVYLLSDNRNPDRALLLINQAIRFLPARSQNRVLNLSHFHDTRGLALMQLNRFDEAVASFELAIQSRPSQISILENLVKCYEGRIETQANSYRIRMATALMQDERFNEAAIAFEMALKSRPTSQMILRSLVQCFEGRDEAKAILYRERLQKIENPEKVETPKSVNGPGSATGELQSSDGIETTEDQGNGKQ